RRRNEAVARNDTSPSLPWVGKPSHAPCKRTNEYSTVSTCCEGYMRDDLVERLFSLLTSADRAEAMGGDLIQERQPRGSRWFWWHAFVTAVALWGTAVAKAPLRTLLVAAAGCALLSMPVFAGV